MARTVTEGEYKGTNKTKRKTNKNIFDRKQQSNNKLNND